MRKRKTMTINRSILRLKKMFGATISVLRSIANDRSVSKCSRGDASGALRIIVTFDFVFILLLMEKIMKITDVLCQTLQKKNIDILNAVDSVSTTKVLLGELRNNGWEPLLEEVKLFCGKHEIDILDLSRRYIDVTKSRNKNDNTTAFHHYKVDVFNVAIDQQLAELEDRFSSQATELLSLCASLDPRLDTFNIDNICTLVDKYYPADFSSQERAQLESQLPHFQIDVCNHPELKELSTLADLTSGLFKTYGGQVVKISINSSSINCNHRKMLFSYETCEDTSQMYNGRWISARLFSNLY